jgi:hypothetical protein
MARPAIPVKVNIGDVCVLLTARRPESTAYIRDRYRAFLSDREPDFEIEMAWKEDVDPAGFLGVSPDLLESGQRHLARPDDLSGGEGPNLRAAEAWDWRSALGTESAGSKSGSRPQVSQLNGLTLFQRSDFAGCLDLNARRGRTVFEKNAEPFAVESFLRISYSFLAVDRGGLLLHSAGVLRNGRGYIFPGRSGTGKSTIASLATSTETVLSDEMVVVRQGGDGYLVYSTPFYGTNPSAERNIAALLQAAFLPVKDQAVNLKPARPAQALSKLLAGVLFFSQEPALARRLMDIGADIVTHVPFYELHFRRDGSFWACIAELEKAEV